MRFINRQTTNPKCVLEKKEYMKKFIPYPSLCLIQIFTLMIILLIISPVVLYTSRWVRFFSIILLCLLFIIDFCLFLLSFIKFWNVPIIVFEDGLSKKREKKYLWSEVSMISLTMMVRIQYGYLLRIIVIEFNDGNKILFEYNKPIDKSIHDFCDDKGFLDKFDKALERI